MADGFTDLEEKIMAILVKERKNAAHVIADAHEIAGLLDLQNDVMRKALDEAQTWICGEDCGGGNHRKMCLKLQALTKKPNCVAGCLCKKNGGSCTPERTCTRCGCIKQNDFLEKRKSECPPNHICPKCIGEGL